MAKKLWVVWLSITIITFSSIYIYASEKMWGKTDTPKESLAMADDHSVFVIAMGKEEIHTKTAEAVAAKTAAKAAEKEKNRLEKKRYCQGLAAYICKVNQSVSGQEAMAMAESFVKYSDQYKVDEKMVMAIAQNESCYYPDVISCADFKGLMQTGDGLARNAGYHPKELFNPEISIKVGARYFGIKIEEFGNTKLALTAYNQGSGAVHSGDYSVAYADLAMARAKTMEKFLKENGYADTN